MVTRADYDLIFERECAIQYPMIDGYERSSGYALDLDKLERAAQALACPLKRNPPNWQHGRVLYSCLRNYLSTLRTEIRVQVLDIGTAKGFSALCMKWALMDVGLPHQVTSIDVINPDARVSRNTVAELDGLKTLREILQPWPEASAIDFFHSAGFGYLNRCKHRIHFAFVDGKHTGRVVAEEANLLKHFQSSGDIVVFDDVHLPDVAEAVNNLKGYHGLFGIQVLPNRAYRAMMRD